MTTTTKCRRTGALLFAAAAMLLMLLGAPSVAAQQGASSVSSVSFGPAGAQYSDVGNLDQCNPANGTLENVVIDVSATVTVEYEVETIAQSTEFGNEQATVEGNVSVSIDGPGLRAPLVADATAGGTFELETPGVLSSIFQIGEATYAAPHGASGELTETATSSITLSAAAGDDLSPFIGTGTIAYNLSSDGSVAVAFPVYGNGLGGGTNELEAAVISVLCNYSAAVPGISIEKTTNGADADNPDGADVPVVNEGDLVTWTYVVTNTGQVDLDNVVVADDVEGVICTYQDNPAAILAAGASFTCELEGIAQQGAYANVATVTGDPTDGQPPVSAEDPSHYVGKKIINLRLVKEFTEAQIGQGQLGTFNLYVSNSGPSDATDVSVLDTVDDLLVVESVEVIGGVGDCSASIGQQVDCTVDVPVGTRTTITVTYTPLPTVGGPQTYGTGESGSEFRFVFVNGYVLEGAAYSQATLTAPDGTVTILDDLNRRNDYLFVTPFGDDFTIHLSCSSVFTDGWTSNSDGPTPEENPEWQIAEYSIARYRGGDFFKYCGEVVQPVTVDNVATATGEDDNGPQTETGEDSVVVVDPEQRVIVDSYCDSMGRFDIYIANDSSESRTYQIEVGTQVREVTLRPGASTRIGISGRPNGVYPVAVSLLSADGTESVVHAEEVTINCGEAALITATTTVSCAGGNGLLRTVLAGASSATVIYEGANYTIEKNTTNGRTALSGRPDGEVTITVISQGAVVATDTVTVRCDIEADVAVRCLGFRGLVSADLTNTSGAAATYTVTIEGANYSIERELTLANGRSGAIRVSGRPSGDVTVTVERDGAVILSETLTISC